MDFNSSVSKIEKEQQKRRDDAKKKREKEQLSRITQQKHEEELRELGQKRKTEMEEAEMERQRVEDEERQLTGGIDYQERLIPIPIEGEDDKVILPESALEKLSSQDSFGKGAAVFQITVTNSDGTVTITHCGVREFSSSSGTIGLPTKVIDSLWTDSKVKGIVSIKYVKLSKVTYVKLQPKFNTFFKVEQIKMVLEENLKFHSTLTIGDIITVWFRGEAHPLRIVEMKPFEKGVLLDTDVEVDLENSLESVVKETAIHENEKNVVKSGKSLGQSTGYKSISTSSTSSIISNSTDKVDSTFISRNEINTDISTDLNKCICLPSEPAIGEEDVINIRVRTPAGSTLTRRFLRKEPFLYLFEFASTEMQIEKNVLQLSTRFPNRIFTLNEIELSGPSFIEAGITSTQEMFLASVIM